MNNSAAAQYLSLTEFGVLAAGILAAAILYFLFKAALERLRLPAAEGGTSLLSRYERKRVPLPLPGVLHGFILIVLYLIVLFAVFKGALGVNITPFLATSAIFTALLGLALQGVLSNVLAGISLNLTKSFSRGDWVKIGAHEGVVLDTNWRGTLILDRTSTLVVLPTNTMASEMIVNFARPDHKTELTIPLKVSSGAPPVVVLNALLQAAREVPAGCA